MSEEGEVAEKYNEMAEHRYKLRTKKKQGQGDSQERFYPNARLIAKRPKETTKSYCNYYKFALKIPHVSIFKIRAV